MTTAIVTNSLIIQGTGQATRAPATTNPSPTTNRDVQDAARELREAIRNNIDQEIIAQKAQAVARAAKGQAAQAQEGLTPAMPPGRQITIQGPDGRTVIGVPPGLGRDVIPPQAVDIFVAFFIMFAAIIIGLPIARAFARRMDRRSGPAQIPNEIASQLTHLNQAVDAIALEVERISEGQRYTTRLLSEQRDAARQSLPSGTSR
jgi:outer membrane murein-binding lipoprotein Lpp